MPSSRYKYATLPAFHPAHRASRFDFSYTRHTKTTARERKKFSFVPPGDPLSWAENTFKRLKASTERRKKEKSFTTNATSEQKHQSLLEIGISFCGFGFGFHLHHHVDKTTAREAIAASAAKKKDENSSSFMAGAIMWMGRRFGEAKHKSFN
jgi:hypothetical protein